MDIRITLITLVGVVIAAQWLHLWVRQRGNPRIATNGPMEPQVIGLGASFVTMVFLWVIGLRVALMESDALSTPTWVLALALVSAVSGAGLRIAAIERIGKGFSWGSAAPDKLITDGVYRVMKHPLIAGFVLEGWALGLCGPTTLACTAIFIISCITIGMSAGTQSIMEERVLAARFPEEWSRYTKSKIL